MAERPGAVRAWGSAAEPVAVRCAVGWPEPREVRAEQDLACPVWRACVSGDILMGGGGYGVHVAGRD
eukprot:3357561-Prymnesium_polylepis.1